MRRPAIAGNWKMHLTVDEAVQLAEALRQGLSANLDRDLIVFPHALAVTAVVKTFTGTAVQVGVQNVHAETSGAFTGEISAPMAKAAGCTHALVGHSERRLLFGETEEMTTLKVPAVLKAGLRCILCVGETLAQREAGGTTTVIERQLESGLRAVAPGNLENLLIAYEPVWAIGTGKNATPEQAQETHRSIRVWLRERFAGAGETLRVLYGGSVKPENAAALQSQPDVDGVLVGGASLKAESFVDIVNACPAR